jgi:dual specificity tyrosine-phosphorylation-regulated kinase 2/3/4
MFPFVHFLKQILKWDPKDRITPLEALKHPWITFGLPN